MRLSRTDLVPLLAIIAGEATGVLAFVTLLLWSPPADVPAPEQDVSLDANPRVEIVEIMAGPENARTGWSPPTRRLQ